MSDPGPSGLAVAGFVIAVIALVWQVSRVIWSIPHVRVGRSNRYGAGLGGGDLYDVIVINRGEAGVTVTDVGITLLPQGSGDRSVRALREAGHHVAGPMLPARLEPHDAQIWTLDADLMVPGAGAVRDYGWAHRWGRRRPWSTDPLRRLGLRIVKSPIRKTTY